MAFLPVVSVREVLPPVAVPVMPTGLKRFVGPPPVPCAEDRAEPERQVCSAPGLTPSPRTKGDT